MRRLRQGAIVGFGNVAARGHLPGWRARDDFHICAVTDPDPARCAVATQLLPGVRTYATLDALLDREQLDFVDVASPPVSHPAVALAAAARGIHVLCEKPLATALPDYVRMVGAAQAADTVLHTVHNWKHAEAFLRARRWLAEDAIGSLRYVSFETLRAGCAAATAANWRVDAAVAGGGILVDHGWHTFYLLANLVGERPQRIRARLERLRDPAATVEDTAHCVIDFPSCVADVHLTWAAATRRTCWRFEGTRGRLLVDDDRLILEGSGIHREERLGSALSAGSHHPEWFAGVLESFSRALDDRSLRGANLAEAELCVLLLTSAYASSAAGSSPRDIPDHAPCTEEAAPSRGHRDHLTADGR